MERRERLLVNWVYYPPIGHTIEAYRHADGFRNGSPELEIGVMINAKAGVALAGCLPQIDHVYPIDVSAFQDHETSPRAFEAIEPEWDYVLTDPRHERPMGRNALNRCEKAFRAFIRPRIVNKGWDISGFPPFRRRSLALRLPESARRFAKAYITDSSAVRISVLLGSGSGSTRTPPIPFWRRLFHLLVHEFDDLEIVLFGTLQGSGSRTRGIADHDIDSLLSEFPQVRNGFDKGLLNQLAIAETCDLHISPHTGMSFAIQSVGVPWLILSGGEVPETLLNGVPFYAIFPECPQYSCGPWVSPGEMLSECLDRKTTGEPFLCLTEGALSDKLPEILRVARLLVNRELTYHQCFDRHYRELLPRLRKQPGDWFFDGGREIADKEFVFTQMPGEALNQRIDPHSQ